MENSICHRRGPTGGVELADPSAIEMHGACAAFAEVAAFLGPGESTVLAERVKQRYARVDRWRMVTAVDPQADRNRIFESRRFAFHVS
jgi:hypothetical protein